MNKENFQAQFDKVKKLIDYEDFTLLSKRIIDFTLDTGNLKFYRQTIEYINWLEDNQIKIEEVKKRSFDLLDNLYKELTIKDSSLNKDSDLISINNLTKSYKKSAFTLGPISINIAAGQIIGLVGENGNGKTTLLRTLCKELCPSSGSVDYKFPYSDNYDLRSKLIYIPQRTPSWQGSLLSNLRFTASTYGITGEENILTVDLIIDRMGLRKYRNYKWKDLSSGYKMRFELARALLRKPQLLLIDEPLANLDILAQQIVLDDFRDIARSTFRPLGIVLSSQQLYEVEKTSDYVIFLKNGAPKNLGQNNNNCDEIVKFIIEFESEWDQDQLLKTFLPLGIESLQVNGGTYVACFPQDITLNHFLKIVLEQKVPLTYFRNISNSTRRFFLS